MVVYTFKLWFQVLKTTYSILFQQNLWYISLLESRTISKLCRKDQRVILNDFREPGFHPVVWFVSSPTTLPPSPVGNLHLSFSVFLFVAGRAHWREGGGGARSQHRTATAWSSTNHSVFSEKRWTKDDVMLVTEAWVGGGGGGTPGNAYYGKPCQTCP